MKPILHFWREGKVKYALDTLDRKNMFVIYDCISTILHTPALRMGLTPEVGSVFIKKLIPIMENKHSTYVKSAMNMLN